MESLRATGVVVWGNGVEFVVAILYSLYLSNYQPGGHFGFVRDAPSANQSSINNFKPE
jgi:hypothetical protein